MSEIAQAFQWVVSTMQADSALVAAAQGGIWQGFADIGVVAPYALVVHQSGTDVLTLQAVRLWSSLLLQLKAVGPTASYAALVVIADRIDALFKDRRSVGLSGSGGVLSCYRDGALSYSELINGAAWGHLGGLYRIDLQGS